MHVFKTGQGDGLKKRSVGDGKNVNWTVWSRVKCIPCVGINLLALPTGKPRNPNKQETHKVHTT